MWKKLVNDQFKKNLCEFKSQISSHFPLSSDSSHTCVLSPTSKIDEIFDAGEGLENAAQKSYFLS